MKLKKNNMKLTRITNLNFLDKEKLLIDDKGRIYTILDIYLNQREGQCTLKLLQLNDDYFATWGITIPIACDRDYKFQSSNDKDFVFMFSELDVTKKEAADAIADMIERKKEKE